jgi:hypothetical protein
MGWCICENYFAHINNKQTLYLFKHPRAKGATKVGVQHLGFGGKDPSVFAKATPRQDDNFEIKMVCASKLNLRRMLLHPSHVSVHPAL